MISIDRCDIGDECVSDPQPAPRQRLFTVGKLVYDLCKEFAITRLSIEGDDTLASISKQSGPQQAREARGR
jgi:hypothetical protein